VIRSHLVRAALLGCKDRERGRQISIVHVAKLS
jgi:hypothetical protein